MSMAEKRINAEMKAYYDSSMPMIYDFIANYNELSKGRGTLPLNFLTKENIKVFIVNLNKKYNSGLVNKQKTLQKLKDEYTKLKPDNSEKAMTRKEFLKEEILIKSAELKHPYPLSFDDQTSDHKYFYEDLLMFISNSKHAALQIYQHSTSFMGELGITIDQFESELVLHVSEDKFKELGIGKVTSEWRQYFVKENKHLNNLKKLSMKNKSIVESSKKLFDALVSDEHNYRRFLDRANSKMGF